MSATEVKIVEAAQAIFAQRGVRGTNMTEVAAAAGVSRQTVYTIFGNRDELLAAAMRHYTLQMLEKIRTDGAQCATISDKIEIYLQRAILEPYEFMQNHPDLQEFLIGVGAFTGEVAKEIAQTKAQALAELLKVHEDELKLAQVSAADLADFVASAANELKYASPDRATLDRQLGLLKRSVVALVRHG